MTRKIFTKIGYILFALAFVFVTAKLFFTDYTDSFLAFIYDTSDRGAKESMVIEKTDLKIIFPEEAVTLDPFSTSPVVKQRLINIYDSLVETDRDLNLRPSLAVTWGLIDDVTWEFELRPGVKFHDGSELNAQDVKYTMDLVLESSSELSTFIADINEVKIVDNLKFIIKTDSPDPLLLQRLSKIPILPDTVSFQDLAEEPVGTGPYRFVSWVVGGEFRFKANDFYWGEKPKYLTVSVFGIPNKFERVNRFLSGGADVLAFAPYDAITALKDKGFSIISIPSLEVQFLIFNFKNQKLITEDFRRALFLSLDTDYFSKQLGDYVRPVSQFVSSGIFGFNPEIEKHIYSMEEAKKIVDKMDFDQMTVQLHLPVGLNILGDYVRTQARDLGINVVVSYLEGDKFFDSFQRGVADIYFLGFRSDLGDASTFFDALISSDAEFNFVDYLNVEVDKLLTDSLTEFDERDRLEKLQRAMEILVEDDLWGIPLFEYETVYAFLPELVVSPRIDGQIFFDDITLKNQ